MLLKRDRVQPGDEQPQTKLLGFDLYNLTLSVDSRDADSVLQLERPTRHDLSAVHGKLVTELQWTVQQHGEDMLRIRGYPPVQYRAMASEAPALVEMEVHNPRCPTSCSAFVKKASDHGRTPLGARGMQMLSVVLPKVMAELTDSCGLQRHASVVINLTFNTCITTNNNNNYQLAACGAELSGGGEEQRRSDGVLGAAWLSYLAALSDNEKGPLQVVYCRKVKKYFYFKDGLWEDTSDNQFAANAFVAAMQTAKGGAFWQQELTPVERSFLDNERGSRAVLNRATNDILDRSFAAKLDSKLHLLPFTNGVLELKTGTFRPLRWDDYVTTTTGYAYVPRD